jgi:hypothetical protein
MTADGVCPEVNGNGCTDHACDVECKALRPTDNQEAFVVKEQTRFMVRCCRCQWTGHPYLYKENAIADGVQHVEVVHEEDPNPSIEAALGGAGKVPVREEPAGSVGQARASRRTTDLPHGFDADISADEEQSS